MQRFIFQIISVTKQKISNNRTKNTSDDVGDPVVYAPGTAWDEGFLHDFGERPIKNAYGQCDPQGLSTVGLSVFLKRFAVAPQDGEGESCIHQHMHHLVESNDGLDMGKTRTRQPSQQKDHCCTKDSRVTISRESVQEGSLT